MCEHLERARRRKTPVRPGTLGCAECLVSGDVWVHLRLCLTCGHVGCCDDSPNRHATRHFHATAHPVARSFEPGETWAWCFADEELADELPVFAEESAARHYRPGESHAHHPR
jgi:uncharacterized UBP type Zn finger protein